MGGFFNLTDSCTIKRCLCGCKVTSEIFLSLESFQVIVLSFLCRFLILCSYVVIFSLLFQSLCGIGIDEASVLIPLLGLPFGWTALELLDLHLLEALSLPIVPLEDILHALSLLLKLEPSLSAVLRLELGHILFDQIELDHMLLGCKAAFM